MRTPLAWRSPSICPARRAIRNSHRLYRYSHEQFVKETLPPRTAFDCVGSGNAVSQFEHRHD